MIRAKLEGRKTQTRRIVKLPKCDWPKEWMSNGVIENDVMTFGNDTWGKECDIKCPYGNVGDILYAKETFSENRFGELAYRADGEEFIDGDGFPWVPAWKPSIYMPKAAARIIDEITGIRAERVQDISEYDAAMEGVEYNSLLGQYWNYLWTSLGDDPRGFVDTAIESYKSLWIKINGKESWDANPWVWVIETKNLSTTGWNNLNTKQMSKLNIILPEKKGIRPGDWVKIIQEGSSYLGCVFQVIKLEADRVYVKTGRFLISKHHSQVRKLKRRAEIRTVKSGKNKGQFYVELIGDNGEPLDDVYTTKAKARKTLKKYFPSFKITDGK